MEKNDKTTIKAGKDANPDPITGAPGSHPVATGMGAAAAGAAGAAIGSIVPGIGTVIGGAVGAVVGAVGGGYAGKAVGEALDPTDTDTYWQENFKGRDYAKGSTGYDQYKPAYRYGAALADQSGSSTFDEKSVRSEWESQPESKALNFDSAKNAIRDEFNRKIQLREEQLRASKQRVSAGEVGIHKEVTTERKTIEVPVEREEVVITRHAASGTGAVGEIKDEQIRIPVSEERVNFTKETVVTGEVEVAKRKVTETRSFSDDVRKEDVRVDKTGEVRVDDQTKKKV